MWLCLGAGGSVWVVCLPVCTDGICMHLCACKHACACVWVCASIWVARVLLGVCEHVSACELVAVRARAARPRGGVCLVPGWVAFARRLHGGCGWSGPRREQRLPGAGPGPTGPASRGLPPPRPFPGPEGSGPAAPSRVGSGEACPVECVCGRGPGWAQLHPPAGQGRVPGAASTCLAHALPSPRPGHAVVC